MSAEVKTMASPARLIDMIGPWVYGVEGEGRRWLVLKSLCEALGLNWSGESRRLKHDPKFTPTRISLVGSDGKGREMLCLPSSQLNGWLFSINSDRVGDECRERVRAYQQASLMALNDCWAETVEAPSFEAQGPVERGPDPYEAEEPGVCMATLEERVVTVMKDLLGDFVERSS